MSLRTQVVAQQATITELQAANRGRHATITELLAADQNDTKEKDHEHVMLSEARWRTKHNTGRGVRRNERATRECITDFMKCQPLNFKGTEGVVELTQWVEKMETKMTDKYCPRTEIKKLKVELWDLKVKGGLPDMIHGSVVASKPKTMQEATEIAPNDDKAYPHFLTDRQNENKTKEDNNSNNTTQNKRRHDRALSCWDW
ncbi:hypothetical protein Tco_0794518 [Tanacetum coccineum]